MLGSGNSTDSTRRKTVTECKSHAGKMSLDTKRSPTKSSSEDCKSPQDSQMDSGFMSGSNLLVSSSSLCNEEMGTTDRGFQSDTRTHPEEGPAGTSKEYTLSENLDSGIDLGLSERIGTLNLSSSSGPTEEAPTSPEVLPTSHIPQNRSKLAELGLSQVHITILKEIFKKDSDGDTQLHLAVMRGFVEVVWHITRLIPHQALLDIPNNSGKTALHLAVSSGDASLARHLVVCGASPVAKNRKGETPLHIACRGGDPLMVSFLTSQVTVCEVMAARLFYPPNHTPGLLAADLNNYDGQTCIHIAAQFGHTEILQHLTWYGADINAKEGKCGRTALHLAVEARNKDVVRFLVESCRAAQSIHNYAAMTPYQLAVANAAPDVMHLLEELGSKKDPLPLSYTTRDEDDEDEDDEEELEYDEDSNFEADGNYPWAANDLRIGGMAPVPLQFSNPIPVSTHSSFNADQYL